MMEVFFCNEQILQWCNVRFLISRPRATENFVFVEFGRPPKFSVARRIFFILLVTNVKTDAQLITKPAWFLYFLYFRFYFKVVNKNNSSAYSQTTFTWS